MTSVCRLSVALLLCLTLGASLASAGTGVLYAPGGSEEGSGIGVELLRAGESGSVRGAALWFAGSIAPSPDVDTAIPHGDFYSETYDSRWGLLYLVGKDTGKVTLLGGVGVALVTSDYRDISNVTGWSWDGGSKTSVEPQFQAGLRIPLSESGGVRLGFDTQFGAFAGASFGF